MKYASEENMTMPMTSRSKSMLSALTDFAIVSANIPTEPWLTRSRRNTRTSRNTLMTARPGMSSAFPSDAASATMSA